MHRLAVCSFCDQGWCGRASVGYVRHCRHLPANRDGGWLLPGTGTVWMRQARSSRRVLVGALVLLGALSIPVAKAAAANATPPRTSATTAVPDAPTGGETTATTPATTAVTTTTTTTTATDAAT